MRISPELKATMAKAMRGSWLDRTINYVAPLHGIKRAHARAVLAFGGGGFGVGGGFGYTGARWDRNATKTWITPQLAADEITLRDLPTLRNRSHDLIRNNPIGRGAIQTVVQNTVGSGLKLQASPDAEALGLTPEEAAVLKKQIEREWRLFAETTDCDLTRYQNFYGLQDLAFRSALAGGDCFAMLPMVKRPNAVYQTCVQLFEAEQIINPLGALSGKNLRDGVEIDDNGSPVAYHVRKFHPNSTAGIQNTESVTVPAFGAKTGRRNILHLLHRERPGQSRGVPYLAPVIELLKQLDKYSEAELMAAVVSALFTVFIESTGGDGIAAPTPDQLDASAASSAAVSDTDVALGNGSIVDLMPGEKAQFADPARPNANFDPFFISCVRQIGVALSIPFEVLIKHFTASYSAARAALLDAWTFFYNRRDFLANGFCQPVYEALFDEAVALGRIDAPGYFDDAATRLAYLRAKWVGDAPPSIDPQKEAEAAKILVDEGFSTREEQTMRLTGGVWEDNHPQQVREKQMRVKDGLEPAQPQPGDTGTAPKAGRPTNAPNPNKPEQGDMETA